MIPPEVPERLHEYLCGIARQEFGKALKVHHRRQTFEEGSIEFFDRHGVDCDPERIWD